MRCIAASVTVVGRAVALVGMFGRCVAAGEVLVWSAGGVIGRLVGVELVVWGSWQASTARISRTSVVRYGLEEREIMLLDVRLLGKHVIQDEKQAATQKQ